VRELLKILTFSSETGTKIWGLEEGERGILRSMFEELVR
jgi:hypothetical protein